MKFFKILVRYVVNIFSHCVTFIFILLMVFVLNKSTFCLRLFFLLQCFWCILWKIFNDSKVMKILSYSILMKLYNFTFHICTYKELELIFFSIVIDNDQDSIFSSMYLTQYQVLKSLSSNHTTLLVPLLWITSLYMLGLFKNPLICFSGHLSTLPQYHAITASSVTSILSISLGLYLWCPKF